MVPFSAIIFKNPALQAVWFYYASTPGYKPGDMKISPFRTFSQIDLKSQNFITAWSSTCGKRHQKKQLPVRQDKIMKRNKVQLLIRINSFSVNVL